jgi:hypothetical protein
MFSYYYKLIKTTIKADRLVWLTYIDENLKTQPKNFWKYISKFKSMIKLLPNSNSEQKLLRSRNLLQKHLQAIFPLFLTLLLVQKLRTTLTTLVLIL